MVKKLPKMVQLVSDCVPTDLSTKGGAILSLPLLEHYHCSGRTAGLALNRLALTNKVTNDRLTGGHIFKRNTRIFQNTFKTGAPKRSGLPSWVSGTPALWI